MVKLLEPMTDIVLERFESRYVPDPNSGCWLWLGATDNGKYGRIYANHDDGEKSAVQAHRLAYVHFRGEIPEGLELDHLCRVRSCVNPWHAEPVEHLENIRRGYGAKAAKERNKWITHCPYGHPYSGENLYSHPDGSRKCRKCMTAATIRWNQDQHVGALSDEHRAKLNTITTEKWKRCKALGFKNFKELFEHDNKNK